MHTHILINDPPYGTARLYNGLRLAHALLKRDSEVTAFLMGDAVSDAKAGQKTPAERSSMDALAEATEQADKVLVF